MLFIVMKRSASVEISLRTAGSCFGMAIPVSESEEIILESSGTGFSTRVGLL